MKTGRLRFGLVSKPNEILAMDFLNLNVSNEKIVIYSGAEKITHNFNEIIEIQLFPSKFLNI